MYITHKIIQKWNFKSLKSSKNIFEGCISLWNIPDISNWNIEDIQDISIFNSFSENISLNLEDNISSNNDKSISNIEIRPIEDKKPEHKEMKYRDDSQLFLKEEDEEEYNDYYDNFYS